MAVTEQGRSIVKQYEAERTKRSPLDLHYRQCYEYTYPSLGAGFQEQSTDAFGNAQQAASKQAQLFDSTGTDATRLLSSSVLSSLTPAYTRWFNLGKAGAIDTYDDKDEAEWLEQVSEIIDGAISSSNYHTESLEFMMHMMISGMAGLYITMKNKHLHFETWPLHRLYCRETLGLGRIDTVYRSCFYTVQEAVLEFGLDKLPTKMKEAYKQDEYNATPWRFIHVIRPRIKQGKQSEGKTAKNMPWESTWVHESGEIVRESGFMEMPVIVPRWLKIPDTDYARGPVFDALPDMKTLNKVKEGMLQNMDMHISGMFKVKDDGVINPNTIVFGPRRVIPVGDMDNLQALQSGGDVQFAVAEINSLQASIRKMLLADQLGPVEKSIATATEVQTRNNQVRQVLGPIFSRFQSEFSTPYIERCYSLCASAGMFPPVPKTMVGKEQDIEYRSPLAKSQKQIELQSDDELFARAERMAQINPGVMDYIDMDKMIQHSAELLAVDPEMIRSEQDVKKLRDTRAKAAQAQQQAAMQQQQAAQAQAQPQQGDQAMPGMPPIQG